MRNENRYTVIRDSIAGTTILCETDFKDVAELVANEAAKYIDSGFASMIFIIDNVYNKHERIA